MPNLTTNTDTLRKRLRRLIGEYNPSRATSFAQAVLPLFGEIGKLALIGGAARDVARAGVANFSSDLDFVVYDGKLDKFYKLMEKLGSEKNRYGGYGLDIGRWRVDVWALEDTWARTAGVRRVEHLTDLLDCTFFNVDAIIFDLTKGKILTKKEYFADLQSNILELNLEENPNPRGALVRAIRRGALWQATFGPKLKAFLQREIPNYTWHELADLDASAFRYPVLKYCNVNSIHELICGGDAIRNDFGLDLKSDECQLELPLP